MARRIHQNHRGGYDHRQQSSLSLAIACTLKQKLIRVWGKRVRAAMTEEINTQRLAEEATEPKWGDPIGEERQRELQALLDAWNAPGADHGALKGPFDGGPKHDGVPLNGADVFWLADQVMRDGYFAVRDLHLEGAALTGAHLEKAELRGVHLEGARLWGAHLERANLCFAHLETLYVNPPSELLPAGDSPIGGGW
jgi:hypothetical protein